MNNQTKTTLMVIVVLVALGFLVKNVFFYTPKSAGVNPTKFDEYGYPKNAPQPVYQNIKAGLLRSLDKSQSEGKIDQQAINKLKYLEENLLSPRTEEWKKYDLAELKKPIEQPKVQNTVDKKQISAVAKHSQNEPPIIDLEPIVQKLKRSP